MKTIINQLEQNLENQPQTTAQLEEALRAAAALYLCKYEGQKGTMNQVMKRMKSPNVVETAKARGFKA